MNGKEALAAHATDKVRESPRHLDRQDRPGVEDSEERGAVGQRHHLRSEQKNEHQEGVEEPVLQLAARVRIPLGLDDRLDVTILENNLMLALDEERQDGVGLSLGAAAGLQLQLCRDRIHLVGINENAAVRADYP